MYADFQGGVDNTKLAFFYEGEWKDDNEVYDARAMRKNES